MPTYEFRCPSGHEFERFYRKISDAESELPCPECGAVAGRQLSAGAGLLFKGSGFYLTDYGKNAHRKAGSATGGAKGEGKTEGGSSGGETKSGEAKSGDTKASSSGASEKSTTPSKGSSGGGDKA